jgi:hypothetical protein
MKIMSSFPQHDKLMKLNGANNIVGGFIEWLGENGYTICEASTHERRRYEFGGQYMPTRTNRNQFIANFFEIDADELSREKDRMLEDFLQHKANAVI